MDGIGAETMGVERTGSEGSGMDWPPAKKRRTFL